MLWFNSMHSDTYIPFKNQTTQLLLCLFVTEFDPSLISSDEQKVYSGTESIIRPLFSIATLVSIVWVNCSTLKDLFNPRESTQLWYHTTSDGDVIKEAMSWMQEVIWLTIGGSSLQWMYLIETTARSTILVSNYHTELATFAIGALHVPQCT